MDKKGFTLIELLATIVIMSLILIMVMPSIRALRNNNEKKQYEYYADSLVEAAKIYVNKEGEDINPLGAKNWLGCVDITYQDLLNSDLIKPFTDDNIDCSNAKIRYTKEKNKDTYTINLSCRDLKEGEIIYNRQEIDNNTCQVTDTSDTTPPVCGEIIGSSTTWTNEDREITIKCTDDNECEDVTKVFTETTEVGSITITDSNGNKTECPVDVYVDKTPPTCINSGGNTNFVTGPVTLTGTCTDSNSGCAENNVTKVYNEIGEWVNQSPGTVYDKAGNATECPNDQTVRINSIQLTTNP